MLSGFYIKRALPFRRTAPHRKDRGKELEVAPSVVLGLPNTPWYAEVVVDEKAGEVVHSNSEPLAEHTGHGSDKKPLPESSP